MNSNSKNPEDVKTYISEITLPTYQLKGENPNPVFHSQYGVAHIYPYTLQDEIASSTTNVEYKTLIIENQYLRVTVLPELGGRVYSVFDKISDREVFYKNPVIKFSPLAIRGAFYSGGVEFSFPVAHAPTTADPVNWDLQKGKDGSGSIFIGGQEHISGMRWWIKLTLFPNSSALAQDVHLFNPTPIPGRYHYWTNASLDSDLGTEFVYPLQRVRSYEFSGIATWPIARLDLITGEPGLPGMEGVPMWPAERMHEPFNFRWEKDMLAQVSIFGRKVERDFFGAWQHSINTGYAHYADHKDVSGMKLWSWGKSEVGIVNQRALMDDGSLYAETQCGAMETQLDFDFLSPGVMKTWREWWLPLRDIDGLTCASEYLGVRLFLEQGQDKSKSNLTIAICPVQQFSDAEIKLSLPNVILLHEKISISPESIWTETLTVDSVKLRDYPIVIEVQDSDGKVILNYTHHRESSAVEFLEPMEIDKSAPSENHYQLGLKHENFDNRSEAKESYINALNIDEQHGLANFQMGLMLLRDAAFKSSKDYLVSASKAGIDSAFYYLGLISWYEGDLTEARSFYKRVPANDALFDVAQYSLGCIAFRTGDIQKAKDQFSNYSMDDGIIPTVLSGIAFRHDGDEIKAREIFHQVLETDPLNLVVLNELLNIKDESSTANLAVFERLVADDPQYILDLACFYLDSGLIQDAISILEEAGKYLHHPMVYYLEAYLHNLQNKKGMAKQCLGQAEEIGPEKVFPSRLWEVIALYDVLNRNPEDFKAMYYLGNFLYAHQRFREAIDLWEASLEGLNQFDVVLRNLGLAYWKQEDALEQAVELFEKAMKINPGNQDIYIHLDDLYCQLDCRDKRLKLLKEMQDLDPIREDLRKRSIIMMVDLGKHEQALDILMTEDFVPLEMDQSFHKVYVKALMLRAGKFLESEQVKEAINDYKMALQFPVNHGIGRPTTMQNAEVLYRLGCAYELVGDFIEAVKAWKEAAKEHHRVYDELHEYVQMSLDKLGRYSELGFIN